MNVVYLHHINLINLRNPPNRMSDHQIMIQTMKNIAILVPHARLVRGNGLMEALQRQLRPAAQIVF